MDLMQTMERIVPPYEKAEAACRKHWNSLGKPLYGLGEFEEILVRIAGMQRTPMPDIRQKALVVFCADNGVVAEGVSQTGREVTAIVAENFVDGRSCASIMCKRAGADLFPVDVGMARDTRVEMRKCRQGTSNIAQGAAMSREEAVFAIEAGIEKAEELVRAGYRILGSGEMGIGNTTTASAVSSVLLKKDPEEMAGYGAGLTDEGLIRKKEVIRRAIRINRPDPSDPIDVLSKVGGFDIAAMAGLFLGGAASGVPVVIDGLISAAAAMLAVRMAPLCRHYMLASHMSSEPGAETIFRALQIDPVIHAGLHLGEGTGAAALFPLLDMCADVYYGMTTFDGISVPAYEDYHKKETR